MTKKSASKTYNLEGDCLNHNKITILILACSYITETPDNKRHSGAEKCQVKAAKNKQLPPKQNIYHMFDLSIAPEILHVPVCTLLFLNAGTFCVDDNLMALC